jgi:hypothetical protein
MKNKVAIIKKIKSILHSLLHPHNLTSRYLVENLIFNLSLLSPKPNRIVIKGMGLLLLVLFNMR